MIVLWSGPQDRQQAQARAIFVWNQSQVAAASGGTSSTDQYTVSGRSVQDLFTPSALSYPSHVTRQTN